MRRAAVVGVVMALVLLGGCGSESDPDTGQENPVNSATPPPGPTSPGSSSPIEQAKADLAKRLGAGAGEITVVRAEDVTWRDSSLGCPQPGMMYAQVLTEGTRIILEAAGKQYHYHSSPTRAPFLCENPSRPAPSMPTKPTPTTPTGPVQGGPVEQAKADLAQRLGVQPAQVKLVSAEEVTWRDGSLGCPQPGMRYTQALVNGSRIVLESGGKKYEYHSGGRRGPFLCTNPEPPTDG